MRRIIVVDLDGTLVNSDMLLENLFLFLRLFPFRFFSPIAWLMGGRANLKRRLADAVLPDVGDLPYNKALLSWLNQQKENGATLVLATASEIRIANAIADHLGVFDKVLGTEDTNLSSVHKCAALIELYGENHYEYIGNSSADFAVWQSADLIHVANPERGVLAMARKLGKTGQVFDDRPAYFPTLLKALRVHQWAKNMLLFVPLLASHRVLELPLLWSGLIAVIAFNACASSVYLLNDLLDLSDDRQHPTKKNRPLASGSLPILHAMFLIPALLIGALALALWQLPVLFLSVMTGYFVLTLTYSLWLKRVVMLDVITLAILYTIRVVAGAAAMSLVATFWILAFCMFIFLSLAFVKRSIELGNDRQKGKTEKSAGRGYYPADLELLASLGGSAAYISVLVLALYINEAASGALYSSPQWMWLACPLLLFWLGRVWLLAHRGQMHDDPVVFALRDKVSRWIGLAFILVFTLASF